MNVVIFAPLTALNGTTNGFVILQPDELLFEFSAESDTPSGQVAGEVDLIGIAFQDSYGPAGSSSEAEILARDVVLARSHRADRISVNLPLDPHFGDVRHAETSGSPEAVPPGSHREDGSARLRDQVLVELFDEEYL